MSNSGTITAGIILLLVNLLIPKDRVSPRKTGVSQLPEQDLYGIRAVQRAVTLLEEMARDNESSITQLAQQTGLHKSTVHRLLVTLEATGLVRQDPKTGHYRLGFKLMELGAAAIRSMELRTTAHPHLEELAKATACNIHLGILDRGQVVFIDKIEGEGSFRLYSQIGRRAPIHCTALGKVLVGRLPLAEQKRLLTAEPLRRYTRRTIIEPERILQIYRQAAEQGYAIDAGEHEDLIHCIAAPIFNYTGEAVCAASVTAVCAELLPQDRERYLSRLLRCTAAVSAQLGYKGPLPVHQA